MVTGVLARRQDIEIEVERFENARDAIYKVPLCASQLMLQACCFLSGCKAVCWGCLTLLNLRAGVCLCGETQGEAT